MDTISSTEFRKRFASLEQPVLVTVNGHPTETWKTSEKVLPPNGWYVSDGKDGKLVAWLAPADEHTLVFAYVSEESLRRAIAAIKQGKPGLAGDAIGVEPSAAPTAGKRIGRSGSRWRSKRTASG